MGVSLQIDVDKASNTVLRRYRWFGHTYSQRKAELNAAHQLSIKLTMSQTQGTERTELYAVMMHDNHTGKQFRVAQGIKGKHEAEAIKQSILDLCITDQKQTLAA